MKHKKEASKNDAPKTKIDHGTVNAKSIDVLNQK